MEIDHSLL